MSSSIRERENRHNVRIEREINCTMTEEIEKMKRRTCVDLTRR